MKLRSSILSQIKGRLAHVKTAQIIWSKPYHEIQPLFQHGRTSFVRCLSTTEVDASDAIHISVFDAPRGKLLGKIDHLLGLEVGSLDQALAYEVSVVIAACQAEAIANPLIEKPFYQARELLERLATERAHSLEASNIEIKLETINLALDCWRIISNAHAERHSRDVVFVSPFTPHGQALLQRMQALSIESCEETGAKVDHPNNKSYNIVLDAYAKQGLVDEAQALFDEMADIGNSSQLQCRPNTISYNILLSAHANAKTSKEAYCRKARDILDDMLSIYMETGSPDLKPDIISFSSVLSAYANAASSVPEAAQDAEDLLKLMIELYNSSLPENGGSGEWLDLKPNAISVTSCISAWGNSGVPEAAERSTDILRYMHDVQDDNSEEDSLISAASMTAMMKSFGHSEGGVQQAEAVLENMAKMAEKTGREEFMPSSISFTALLNSLAQSAAVKAGGDNGSAGQQAEKIVSRIEDMYADGRNIRIQPTTIVYNAVINCWAKGMHRDSGVRAEGWLDKMEAMHSSGQEHVKPDYITFSSVIDAYANIGSGSDAERVLNRHIDAYRRGIVDTQPTAHSYCSTINAYAKCQKPEDAERILQQLEDLSASGETSEKPNAACYNAVINAFAKSGDKRSFNKILEILSKMENIGISDTVTYTTVIEFLSGIQESWAEAKAIEILDKMWNRYEEGNMNVKPTTVTYNTCLNVLAKNGSAEEAMKMLQDLEQKYDEFQTFDLRPNCVSFNICLNALSKNPTEENLMKADTLLDRMQKLSENGNPEVSPDSFSMTSVLSAWANSNIDGAAQRAEMILQQMQNMYEHGNKNLKPTVVAFGAVLHAWARTGEAERAEAIVDHMEKLSELDEYKEIRPNSVVYNTLINAFAKKGGQNATAKAETVLSKMETLSAKGIQEAQPSRISYNSVLSVYQRNPGLDTLQKGKHILDRMESDSEVNPDVVTYTTYLNILAKSRHPDMIEEATRIVAAMEKKVLEGDKNIRPNNFTYDAILRICAVYQKRSHEMKRKTLILAVKTMTKFQDAAYIQPSSLSYLFFIRAVNRLSSGRERVNLLERSLQDCCQDGQLSDKIIDMLKQSNCREMLVSTLKYPGSIEKVNVKQLPKNWSRKAGRGIPSQTSQRKRERLKHQHGRGRVKK